jgi:hypothetical protein
MSHNFLNTCSRRKLSNFKSEFLNLSRDKLKILYMALLRGVYRARPLVDFHHFHLTK